MKIAAFSLMIFLLAGCDEGRFSYKPLSFYKIRQNALKNKAEVEFIYHSGGPAKEEGQDFLYQYVVVAKATGDTVRVLSPDLLHSANPGDMNYISLDPETKIDSAIVKTLGYKESQYKRVVCNNEYADFENRNYPTVIGFFGYVSQTDPD